MSLDVKVPRLAESISEAVLVEWLKPDGAQVRSDEAIATLETDKAAVEIASPEAGVLRQMRKPGDKVVVDDVIARIEAAAGAPAGAARGGNGAAQPERAAAPPPPASAPAAVPGVQGAAAGSPSSRPAEPAEEPPFGPAVRRLIEEHGLDPARIEASGKGGRLLKEDVLRHLEARPDEARSPESEEAAPAGPAPMAPGAAPVAHRAAVPPTEPEPALAEPDQRIVPMSRIRQRIAERLVRAQQSAAILTTFNEIDMSAVMELRTRHREEFERRHGVRLGFMSFFVRASVLALADVPELNAEIRGTDIVYRRRVHLGVAVGTDRGLVVPVVRDAHRMGFGAIEREIGRLAERAREGTLTLDELSGGTFTISNGGVYGSLLSTPILNPPQSGILGMHKIEKRPVALGDQVAIRPMMYVALSYDHRLVDGEQAVTFLVRVKERIEDPGRMMLDA